MSATCASEIKAEPVDLREHFNTEQIHASAVGIEGIWSAAGTEFRVMNLVETFKNKPMVFFGYTHTRILYKKNIVVATSVALDPDYPSIRGGFYGISDQTLYYGVQDKFRNKHFRVIGVIELWVEVAVDLGAGAASLESMG